MKNQPLISFDNPLTLEITFKSEVSLNLKILI